ncbi:MAG: AAA family ATPase [Clostridia bacterium]|nr:AAA family ATPase [Clostridia bacterium]
MKKDILYINGIRLDKELPKDNYLNKLSVIKNLKSSGGVTFEKPISFFVGENGIGKSTLIEAIAVNYGFNAEGGSKNYNFSTKQTHSILHKYITLVKSFHFAKDGYFLRAESFYNASSYMDYLDVERMSDDDYVTYLRKQDVAENSISKHNMSHGESFLNIVGNRFDGNGIYILDEPEAALSPTGIMKLMVYINRLVKCNSQFIISTHSPMLISMPDADIFEISEKGINKVAYEETNHFIITKQFLNNPSRMVQYLLKNEMD